MFIDIHGHAYRVRTPSPYVSRPWVTPDELLRKHDGLGIEKAVLLPVVHSEVYLPQSNEDILEMAERSDGRFIPFCNVDPRAVSNAPDAPLGDLLAYYRDRGCRGIGELMPGLSFRDPRVLNLFRCAEEAGLPVIFDGSAVRDAGYGLYDEPGLPYLEECLGRFPRLKFFGHGPPFWAEMGVLEKPGDRASYPRYPVRREGVVPKLFRQYPNLLGDLSAGSGYNALARDPDHAVRFLVEFQDRLFFGTDICFADQAVPLVPFLKDLVERGRIGEDVFRKIARENAAALLRL